jgi:hypothetical protein
LGAWGPSSRADVIDFPNSKPSTRCCVPENKASAKLAACGVDVVWFFDIPILGILIPKMGMCK